MEEMFIKQMLSDTYTKSLSESQIDIHIKGDLAQHFTPSNISNLMVKHIPIENPKVIIDPAVGQGELLWYAKQKWPSSRVIGLDIDSELIMQCRSRFECGGIFKCIDALAASLSNIKRISDEHLLEEGADVVLSNPPFGIIAVEHLEQSLVDLLVEYNLVWESGGKIKKVRIETAFFVRSYQLAHENSYMAILMPENTISGVKNEAFRHFLLNNFRLHLVLSLPEKSFDSSEARICLLVVKKMRTLNKRGGNTSVGVVSPQMEVTQATIISQHKLLLRMDPKYLLCLSAFKKKGRNFQPLSHYIERISRGYGLYAGEQVSFSKNKDLNYIHSVNVSEFFLKKPKEQFKVPKTLANRHPNALIQEGDILLVRVGRGCAGRCAIVNGIPDGGFASDCLYIIRSKRLNPYYLCLFLNSSFAKNYLKACLRGICSQYITKSDLMKLPVFRPKTEVVRKLSQKMMDIHDQIKIASDTTLLLSRFHSLASQLDQLIYNNVNDCKNLLE